MSQASRFVPSTEEITHRDSVITAIVQHVEMGLVVKLPEFDPNVSVPSRDVAGQTVGLEPNPFGGTVGPYRFQFEGEEDLLHLLISRQDQGELTPEEGQQVTAFLLPDLPPSLIWLKPGRFTQHFFFGHDELLQSRLP